MPDPRADFTCLGKKCRTEEGAPTYADLPITTKVCPVCASKRVVRVYNHVNISRPGFYRVNHLVDAAGADALERKHDATDSRIANLKRGSPSFAVPISQLGASLGRLHPAFGGLTVPQGGSKPSGAGMVNPVGGMIEGKVPSMAPGSRVDRGAKMPKEDSR